MYSKLTQSEIRFVALAGSIFASFAIAILFFYVDKSLYSTVFCAIIIELLCNLFPYDENADGRILLGWNTPPDSKL